MFYRKLIVIISILIFFMYSMFVKEKRKKELINIKSGTLISDIIKNFGKPDKFETHGSNYRHITYKIDGKTSYLLSILPNGKLFQFNIIKDKKTEIVFFDELYEVSDNDSRDKRIFYIPLGIQRSEVCKKLGTPDDYDGKNKFIEIYNFSDSISYRLHFSEKGILWKVQLMKNNEESLCRFDSRILNR